MLASNALVRMAHGLSNDGQRDALQSQPRSIGATQIMKAGLVQLGRFTSRKHRARLLRCLPCPPVRTGEHQVASMLAKAVPRHKRRPLIIQIDSAGLASFGFLQGQRPGLGVEIANGQSAQFGVARPAE